jgi:hypothetical protein
MDAHLISYYIGISIVLASHVYMLTSPIQAMKLMTMEQHAYVNLLAVALIAYYFMYSQKYISF